MLFGLLLTALILVCVALIVIILLQQSEGGALGLGSGPSSFMTSRGTGDFLTRTTWILAGLFFFLCFALDLCSVHNKGTGSVIERVKSPPLGVPASDSITLPSTPLPHVAPPPSSSSSQQNHGFDVPRPKGNQPSTETSDPFGGLGLHAPKPIHATPHPDSPQTVTSQPATSQSPGPQGPKP